MSAANCQGRAVNRYYDYDIIKAGCSCIDIAKDLGLEVGNDNRCAATWRGGTNPASVSINRDGWNDFGGTGEKGSAIDLVAVVMFAGDREQAQQWLGDKLGLPVAMTAEKPQGAASNIERVYQYKDLDGAVKHETIRFVPKSFCQRRPARPEEVAAGHALSPGTGKPLTKRDGSFYKVKDGYIWTLQGMEGSPILYRWPEWNASPFIFIVGGEKDVDNLWEIGFPATTNPMGESNWRASYNAPLAGRDILLIPDNDDVGRAHVECVAAHLFPKAGDNTVRILDLGLTEPKADVSDWISARHAEGLTNEQIKAALEQIGRNTPPLTAEAVAGFKKVDGRASTSAANAAKQGQDEKTKLIDLADSFIGKSSVALGEEKFCVYRLHRGQWFLYKTKGYVRISRGEVEGAVIAFLRARYPDSANGGTLNNIITHLGDPTVSRVSDCVDAPCWLPWGKSAAGWTAFKNRIVNVEKAAAVAGEQGVELDEFTAEHSPRLFSTFAVDYEHNPAATCPRWLKYLSEVQPEQEARDAIQMLFGLALVPDTRFEVIFILYGEGGTGKTVCLHVLQHLVGSANVCCVPPHKFDEKFSLHLLTENLLNVVSDLSTSGKFDELSHVEGFLKDVASGGNLPVERKGRDPLMAPAIARNVFATNSLPAFTDRSNGIWDRLRIIPFEQRFRGTAQQNTNLAAELLEELPGIFNWAIEGLAKLRKLRRFPDTPAGAKIAAEHRGSCDHEKEFLIDRYRESTGGHIPSADVYKAYRQFCDDHGYHAKNDANFGRELLRVFPKARKDRTAILRVWANLATQF